MINSKHRRLFNTASGTMLLAVVVFSSCLRNNDKEVQDVEQLQNSASLSVKDLHTVITDSGYYKYEFETPLLNQYDKDEDNQYIDFPNGIKFKMFENHGTLVKSRIRCNNAKYYKQTGIWELNNDVEAVTVNGDILNTEQLFWDTKSHRIYSEKFVRITTKNQLITGYGFESDEQLSRYEIKRPGGEIEIESNE